ncbi:hypothetical protein EAE96_000454 [Botrytis aclada]|nr:hypothetical protein EAE96_000454 [Botrytis aclada]
MVHKRTMEVVIPQMSSQSINSTTEPNKVASKTTPVTFPAMINEEKDLCSSDPPRRTAGELQTKLDHGKMSSVSSLPGHFLSGAREEEMEMEDAGVVCVCGASLPHRTSVQLEFGGDNSLVSASATFGNQREEEIKKEVENVYGTQHPHRADLPVRFELDNHEASPASNETTPQLTPSPSTIDETEENLIDLYDDERPLRHPSQDKTFLSDDFEPEPEPHHAPKSFTSIKHTPYTKTKKLAAPSPPQTHPAYPTTHTIPPHENFFHTLPSRAASIPQIRTWIASWFSGRDISFAVPVPWEDEDTNLQRYLAGISWSGDDIHNGSSESLERDLRGWMLGGYARPIVRDIARARNMERERRWKMALGRLADFLYGAVVMGVVGLVLMVCVPCPCRGN